MYSSLLRPIFFLFPPEQAHYIALFLFRLLVRFPGGKSHCRHWYIPARREPVKAFGLEFPHAVGLAAGFDKNGKFADLMAWLGFGHIEVGTVTPKAQPGNPKPRMFRLPKDKGLINRMGFNNRGVDAVVKNLQRKEVQFVRREMGVIIGGNIGKNKTTPNEEAWQDYRICFEKLFDHVDYFVVNVSSPNTPGLRELQEKEPLLRILRSLQELNAQHEHPKPLLLKIAPDLSEEQLRDVAEVAVYAQLDGLIISNTTIDRSGLQTKKLEVDRIGPGGLSGKPVFERSNEVLSFMRELLPETMDIIGVGGVFTKEDMEKKQALGAKLVQVYTGFIYTGPLMVRKLID